MRRSLSEILERREISDAAAIEATDTDGCCPVARRCLRRGRRRGDRRRLEIEPLDASGRPVGPPHEL